MTQQVSVTLSDRWADYLAGLVADRQFESIDHAVEDALRLLEHNNDREERLNRLLEEGERSGIAEAWDLDTFIAENRDQLRDAIQEGMDGPDRPADEIFAELERRYARP